MAPPKRKEPAKGVLAGVRADIKRAKESGGSYDPVGVGTAWSHNFLNQKPWHPLNFRNQQRVFEAEQKHVAEKKAKEVAKAEFDAEQEYLRSLTYLSKDQQQLYRDKQSVSFLYTKPPGLDAALAKEKKAEEKVQTVNEPEKAAASAVAAPAAQESVSRAQLLDKVRQDPFATVLAARAALETSGKFELRHGYGARSPVHGGFDDSCDNQKLIVDAPADDGRTDEDVFEGLTEEDKRLALKAIKKMRKKEERKRKVEEAKRILESYGYGDVNKAEDPKDSPRLHKHLKKHHRMEKSSKHKHRTK